MITTRRFALSALAIIAIACASNPATDPTFEDVDPALKQGPNQEFGGAWMSNDAKYGAFYLGCMQRGASAVGEMCRIDFSGESAQPPFYGRFTGEVKGRVCESTWSYVGASEHQRRISLTVSADGETATLRGWGPLEMRRVFAFSEAPATHGLFSCRLLFGPDGRMEMRQPPSDQMREAWAGLAMVPTTEQGKSEPRAYVVPRDEPRRVTWLRFRRSAKDPMSYLFDPEFFRAARSRSPLRAKREMMVAGARCWWVFNPVWEEDAKEGAPTVLLGEFYTQSPDDNATPVDVAVLARRGEGGEWKPAPTCIFNGPKLMRVRLVVEAGQPSRVEGEIILAPPVEEFLAAREPIAWQGRTRNRGMQIAREKTLPKLIRDGTTQELRILSQRFEAVLGDVQKEHAQTKERAAAAEKEGSDEFEPLKELELMYATRAEILQGMLDAVRRELDRRK